eukprot:c26499_g1_i2 orf=146-1093(-)
MVLVLVMSPKKASIEFVFQYFNIDYSKGIHSKPYIFIIGLLMAQYTLSGYDASAHMTEETKSSDKNGPYGIISAVAISVVVGWAYLLGVTFAVTDISHVLDSNNDAHGYAIAQIFYDAFKTRYDSGTGGIICLGVVAVSLFFCGFCSVTSNSRMAYAFSRDGAMPFSDIWHRVNSWEVPINAVWLSAFIAFMMALTSLGSAVAFQAMVSIATVALYIAYAIPILLRVTLSCKAFKPGPFHLGCFSIFIGWVAVLWVATITVFFSVPVEYPIRIESLNYTPIAVGVVLVLVIGSWLSNARFWFRGPVANVEGHSLA